MTQEYSPDYAKQYDSKTELYLQRENNGFNMTYFRNRLRAGFLAGIKKAYHSYVWMCQIIIPISFLVAVLQWSGWLSKADFMLHPLMGLLQHGLGDVDGVDPVTGPSDPDGVLPGPTAGVQERALFR